ncbi:hypothetical protein D3C86_2188330 [compost metagenome]|jgi:hypothetical protein
MADALTERSAVMPACYWIGCKGPVLPEYTYNVIRKCNNNIDLMCLIFVRSAVIL